jgi:hypothetical protein
LVSILQPFSKSPAKAPESGIERALWSSMQPLHRLPPREILWACPIARSISPGTKRGPLGKEIPNITPDKASGIGNWSRNDIAQVLLTGTKPDLDKVEGLMAEVVEAGYKHMQREDALAIAEYLKSIPPITNKIK